MSEMEDYYATPEAELGAEGGSDHGLQGTGRAPTTFGDTLSEMWRLLPKVILPLLGYALLWGVLYFGSALLISVGAGVTAAISGPLMVVVTIVGMLFVTALGAYFWTVAFKRLDNVYRYGTKGGEFSFAFQKFVSVLGAFILKGLVMLPFAGVAYLVMMAMIEGSMGSFGGFMTMMGVVFLINIAGWAVYLLVHFADMAVICEDTGAIDAIGRSFELVKGFRNWFYTVGLFLVVGILMWAVMMALSCVVMIPLSAVMGLGMEAMGPEAGLVGALASNLISVGIGLLTIPVFAVANYMIFQSLRARWQVGRNPNW